MICAIYARKSSAQNGVAGGLREVMTIRRPRALLQHLFTYPRDVAELGRIRRRTAAVDHPFERFNRRIRHAKPAVAVADHGVDASVSRVLQLLKDGPTKGLTNTQHASFADSNLGAIPSDEPSHSLSLLKPH